MKSEKHRKSRKKGKEGEVSGKMESKVIMAKKGA
jgi:hypothetical protein